MHRPTGSGTLRRALLLAVAAIVATTLPACGRALFDPSVERTQYDRFDAVRNQYVSQYKIDPYGRPLPNLRGRLLPKE